MTLKMRLILPACPVAASIQPKGFAQLTNLYPAEGLRFVVFLYADSPQGDFAAFGVVGAELAFVALIATKERLRNKNLIPAKIISLILQ